LTVDIFIEIILFLLANDFYKLHLKGMNIQRPVIVFLDGHASHLSLPLSEFCAEYQIILVWLPANATHFLQPLDVGFYFPFKSKWKSFVQMAKLNNSGQEIRKHLIPYHVNKLGLKYFGLDIKNAFRTCGLFPFDEDLLDYSKLVTAQHQTEYSAGVELLNSTRENEIGSVLAVIEAKIDANILEQFQQSRTLKTHWLGDEQFKALFDLWISLKEPIADQEGGVTEEVEFIVNDADEYGISSLSVCYPFGTSTPVSVAAPLHLPETSNEVLEPTLPTSESSLSVCNPVGTSTPGSVEAPLHLPETPNKVLEPTLPTQPVPLIQVLPSPCKTSPLVSEMLDSIFLYPHKDNATRKKINRKQLPSVISS